VSAVAVNVLHHRLSLKSTARIQGSDVDRSLRELILKAKVPME
jgi:MoxR-like ATPase